MQQRKKMREEIIAYLKSDKHAKFVENNALVTKNNGYGDFLSIPNKTVFIDEFVSCLSDKGDFSVDPNGFSYYNVAGSLNSFRDMFELVLIYKNQRRYTIKSGYGGIESFRIIEHSTEDEKVDRQKKKYSTYAVIEKNGKKALIKVLAGDPNAINKSKYLKNEFIDEMEDDEVILLFNLNKDIK